MTERAAALPTEINGSRNVSSEPIPHDVLLKARYCLTMRLLALIYAEMGRQGMTFARMADRLNRSESEVLSALELPREIGLHNLTLDMLSDALCALGCVLEFKLESPHAHKSALADPETQQQQGET